MAFTLVTILHALVCLVLIVLALTRTGDLAGRTARTAAGLFLISSISLSILATWKAKTEGGVAGQVRVNQPTNFVKPPEPRVKPGEPSVEVGLSGTKPEQFPLREFLNGTKK